MALASNSLLAPGSLAIEPVGDLLLGPAGHDILPSVGYTKNLGALSNKYLTLHAAELWVENLVAHDTMATIGGRILIGPTTTLTADLSTSATSIAVKHNNLASGDRVRLEQGGQVEWLAVTSGASGSGPYTYSVSRNLHPPQTEARRVARHPVGRAEWLSLYWRPHKMTVLLWCAVFVLAVSFLGGFAFVDPMILAMRWQDRIDYTEYHHRGLSEPTLHSLLPIAALWQTAVAAGVFLAFWACLQRVEMGWAGGLLVGAFVLGTLWTAGFVALAPKTPRLPVIVSSVRVILMGAATWLVYASV